MNTNFHFTFQRFELRAYYQVKQRKYKKPEQINHVPIAPCGFDPSKAETTIIHIFVFSKYNSQQQ